MKVRAETRFYNQRLREERLRQGLTQARLADLAQVSLNFLLDIEALRSPSNKGLPRITEKLTRIAQVLDVPFDELFPADYLAMLAEQRLPRRAAAFVWVREVSLEALPAQRPELLSGDVTYASAEQADEQRFILDTLKYNLSRHEFDILCHRFGLAGREALTLADLGQRYGLSARVAQATVDNILRKLRHPIRSRALRLLAAGRNFGQAHKDREQEDA